MATSSSSEPRTRYQVPNNDIYKYLIGTWKRNLEWRAFGSAFQHMRTSNTVVLIEEHRQAEVNPVARHLKWSFGKSIQKNELRFGYVMTFLSNPKSSETVIEWQYVGTRCHGKYMPEGSPVMVLNFFLAKSTVTATYRIVDENTMAVCIVEVDEKHAPTIQYGNMFRIDANAYGMEATEPSNI